MDEIERIKFHAGMFGYSDPEVDVAIDALLAALDAEKARYREAYADYHAAMDALDAEKARVKELEARNAELASEVNLCRRISNRLASDLSQLRASIAALADKHEEAERSYEFGDDDPEHFSWHLTMAGELRALLEKP